MQKLPWTFRRSFSWTWGPCNVAEENMKLIRFLDFLDFFWIFGCLKTGLHSRDLDTQKCCHSALADSMTKSASCYTQWKGCKLTFLNIFQWIEIISGNISTHWGWWVTFLKRGRGFITFMGPFLFKVDFEHFSKSIKILGMGTPFFLLATLWNWLHE